MGLGGMGYGCGAGRGEGGGCRMRVWYGDAEVDGRVWGWVGRVRDISVATGFPLVRV